MANTLRRFRREINCDFFHVQLGQNRDGDFASALHGFQTRCSQAFERNLETDDGYVRLHDWRKEDGTGSGALLRLRTDNRTRIGNIDTDDLRDLALNSNEALADYSCFRFFEEFQTLVVHRNRDAGNEARLRFYLEQKAGIRPLSFELLLSRNALQRFQQLQEITTAEIQIALPENLEPETQNSDSSVSQVIALARRSNAATFTVKFSMGHSRKRLMDIGFLKNLFKDSIDQEGERIHAAEIRGRNARGEEVRAIDLIRDRMTEKVALNTGDLPPTLSDFYSALNKAYQNRRAEIAEQWNQQRDQNDQ